MRALLAFDKFKDALSAAAACAAAAGALRRVQPAWSLDVCPLADGGEGFSTLLTEASGGELRAAEVTGPRGGVRTAQFGLVPGQALPPSARAALGVTEDARVAVVEMAAASGLALLPLCERDVWRATTAGTGDLLRAAVAAGATAIVLGVGGSATNDLGLGALVALGLKLETQDGRQVAACPGEWKAVARLGGTLPKLPPLFIACDVSNPLLGRRGAAAVYGPQKGLATSDIGRLDHESARLALMLCARCGKPDTLMDTPGAGAAGGIAFGLMAAYGAQLLPGFDFVAQWLDLDARIAAADVIITGEGRFDESSLGGKGPGAIARRAAALGKRVEIFAGAVTTEAGLGGIRLHAITPPHMPLEIALPAAAENLAASVRDAFAKVADGES